MSIHRVKTVEGALNLIRRVYASPRLGNGNEQIGLQQVVNDYGRVLADLLWVRGSAGYIEVTIY